MEAAARASHGIRNAGAFTIASPPISGGIATAVSAVLTASEATAVAVLTASAARVLAGKRSGMIRGPDKQ